LLFTMLGFYPAQPFSGQYVTGSPLVDAAVLDLGAGRSLRIRGHGMAATLDGRPVSRTALAHAALVAGGELRFH